MKYFLKEWCAEKNALETMDLWPSIRDRSWDDNAIRKLHNKVMKTEMRESKRAVGKSLFDKEIEIQTFERDYQDRLDSGMLWVPEDVRKEVDLRILALQRLPKSISRSISEQRQKMEREEEELLEVVKEQFSDGSIPEAIRNALSDIHSVYSMRRVGSDLFIATTFYWCFHFVNVEIMEDEVSCLFGNEELPGISPIIDRVELYPLEDGRFELHWLIDSNISEANRYRYLTVRFQSVTLDDSFNREDGKLLTSEEKKLWYGIKTIDSVYIPWLAEEMFAGFTWNHPITDENGMAIFDSEEEANALLVDGVNDWIESA